MGRAKSPFRLRLPCDRRGVCKAFARAHDDAHVGLRWLAVDFFALEFTNKESLFEVRVHGLAEFLTIKRRQAAVSGDRPSLARRHEIAMGRVHERRETAYRNVL